MSQRNLNILDGLKDSIEEFLDEHYEDEILEIDDDDLQNALEIDYKLLEQYSQKQSNNPIDEDLSNSPEQWMYNAKQAIIDLYDDTDISNPRILIKNYDRYNPAIRELRDKHLNKLIKIDATVSKATRVLHKADVAAFECRKCGEVTRVKQPLDSDLKYPSVCSGTDCENRIERDFRVNPTLSETINFRKVELQEPPEEVSGGQTPEKETFTVKGDIADNVTAGDNVSATGVYKASERGDTSIFRTYIKGVNIIPEDKEFEEIEITQEEIEQIEELSQDDKIYDLLRDSIAPSLFGLKNEKEAVLYQLFRGVRKNKLDGTTIRGDIHVLFCGDPGTGKTVKNSTKIIKSSGKIIDIKTFVQKYLKNPREDENGDYIQKVNEDIKVMSMDMDGEIEPKTVEAVWKKHTPDKICKLELKDGRKIEATPTHPLFTTDGNAHIKQKTMQNIKQDEFIAVPRKIDYKGQDIKIEPTYKYDYDKINVPKNWNKQFAKFLGILIAEGHISHGSISITNEDEEILDIAKEGFNSLGLDYTVNKKSGTDAKDVRKGCTELQRFLRHIDESIIKNSRGKRVPEPIFSTPKAIRRAFVKAYIDGEVHVDGDTRREFNVGSMSEDLLHDVQRLLDTFGIPSRVKSRKNKSADEGVSYRLRVSGAAFDKYVNEIGFISERKQETAEETMREKRETNTNVDIIPDVGDVLKETRELLGMTQHDFSIKRSTYHGYEYEDKNPPREKLQRMIKDMVGKLRVLRGFEEIEESDLSWSVVDGYRKFASLDQSEVAQEMGYTQGTYQYHMNNNKEVKGHQKAIQAYKSIQDQIEEDLHQAHENLIRLESLAWGDIRWEQVESIEETECDDEWMYDLQVEGTHNYIANGIMSHNSQLLRYASKLSPRGIMTSGKGSSSAGLCVGPDTYVNYNNQMMKISELVQDHIQDPVSDPVAKEVDAKSRSYNLDKGKIEDTETTHLWRMPEQEAKRIQTQNGRELVVSNQTPLLLSTNNGLKWIEASNISEGDKLSVQKDIEDVEFIDDLDMRDFIEFDNELINLKDEKRLQIKEILSDKYGTLRSASDKLGFSEDFVYSRIINRDIKYDKLKKIEDNTDFKFDINDIEDVSLRNGKFYEIPSSFDKDMMWLIGMVIGDGNLTKENNRGLIRISNKSDYVLERSKSIIKDKFGKDIKIEEGQGDRPASIRLHSKTIQNLFENIGMVKAPKNNINIDENIMNHKNVRYLIQGYMDADGGINYRGNEEGSSTISCSSISESWIKQLKHALENKFGIRCNYRIRNLAGDENIRSDGYVINTNYDKHVLELRGEDLDEYVSKIGFSIKDKASTSLSAVESKDSGGETIPVGNTLKNADIEDSRYYNNLSRGQDPKPETLDNIRQDLNLPEKTEKIIEKHTDSGLVWEEVESIESIETELYDLTTKNSSFIANGIITHNTAAAVRDSEFGGDDNWTLQAGALVLADQGLACVDEIDKMDASDRSSMHEGLEQQTISVAKAGINATLKSRCTLLAAANPKEGRWNGYDPVPEQIDLEPALVSRFDMIFAPEDTRENDRDTKLAEHILDTNLRGEQLEAGDDPGQKTDDIEPEISLDLFKKYIAYARQHRKPVMTSSAYDEIRDFFVEIRAEGDDIGEQEAIPITARKIEGLIRVSEAAARIQLSDTVKREHAERAKNIIRSSLKDVGYNEETGTFDADMTESNQSSSQRDRRHKLKQVIKENNDEGEKGAPKELIIEIMTEEFGFDEDEVEYDLNKLGREGDEIYEPRPNEFAQL